MHDGDSLGREEQSMKMSLHFYPDKHIHSPRAMSSSVHLRSGLVWTRHLNTAPGDFTEVLYLESAFGAPTRTLHVKKKKNVVTTSAQEGKMGGYIFI